MNTCTPASIQRANTTDIQISQMSQTLVQRSKTGERVSSVCQAYLVQHVISQNQICFVPQFVPGTPLNRKRHIRKAIAQQNARGNIMTLRGYMSKEWRIAVQSLKQDPSPTQRMCNLAMGENGNFTTPESHGRSMA